MFDPWVGKIPWRRAWQPTLVFLPGESNGQRRLEGVDHGVTESDMTGQLSTAQHVVYTAPTRQGLLPGCWEGTGISSARRPKFLPPSQKTSKSHRTPVSPFQPLSLRFPGFPAVPW